MLDQTWQVGDATRGKEDLEAGREQDISSVENYNPTPRTTSPAWATKLPVPQINTRNTGFVKIDRDMHMVTTKGFRTLGLASTFIAGVEAQFFSVVVVLDSEDSKLLQATNGLLLVGILLSASGAITSLLAARWFELLSADEVVWLEHRWAYARGETHSAVPRYVKQRHGMRNWLVAKALGFPFYLILLGSLSFVAGVVAYSWARQIRPVAIACTTVTGVCLMIVLCMYLKYEAKGVLSHMSFTRTRI